MAQNYFNISCFGQKSCTFNTSTASFPPQCAKKGNQFFIVVNCVGYDITLIKTGLNSITISHSNLTIVVIFFDFVICIIFTIWTYILDDNIHKEKIQQDEDHVQTTDFAVRIKNLPPISVYQDVESLRIMLSLHLQKVLNK